jgi:hypothetical protein
MGDLHDTIAQLEAALRAKGNLFGAAEQATGSAVEASAELRGIITLDSCNRHDKRVPSGALYIGRTMPGIAASPLGNPYKVDAHGASTLDFYAQDLAELVWSGHETTLKVMQSITTSTTLACWCVHRPAAVLWSSYPSRPCHGDVIATMHGTLSRLDVLGERSIADFKLSRAYRVHELTSAFMLVAYVLGFKRTKAWACKACKGRGCTACGETGWGQAIRKRRGRHPSIAKVNAK